MGWTSYHTTHYKKNGDVDRKESIESDIIDYKCFRVEKSTMVGRRKLTVSWKR